MSKQDYTSMNISVDNMMTTKKNLKKNMFVLVLETYDRILHKKCV
jgi:hypothetical protein